jgi:hypothetical protein
MTGHRFITLMYRWGALLYWCACLSFLASFGEVNPRWPLPSTLSFSVVSSFQVNNVPGAEDLNPDLITLFFSLKEEPLCNL